MNRMLRMASGAALGLGALTALPQPALAYLEPDAAAAGFCDTTENYSCCCDTNSAGAITSCKCTKIVKPIIA